MLDLKQSLLACGYSGPCENLTLLEWAIRTGACSQYFNNLICWLESQLRSVTTTRLVRDNINRLFCMLRLSILMKPSYGSETAINPKQFRLQTIKVLTRQLQLRKQPERVHHAVEDSSPKEATDNVELTGLTVTLYMDKNQRQVRL